MLYLSLGIILFFCSFCEVITKNKNFIFAIFLVLTSVLIFFVGLRDGSIVGIDSPVYFSFYQQVFPEVEFGYKWLNALFASNELSYNVFLIFLNALSIGMLAYFFKKGSPYMIFPLLVFYSDFYFYYNFSGIRQGMAMPFVVLSFYFFFQKKNKTALALVLAGSLFHVSALIGLIAYVVPKSKIRIADYFKLMIALMFGILAMVYAIENIPYLSYKFLYYSELQEQEDNIVTSFYIGLIKRFLVIGAVLLIFKKYFNNNENIYYFNLYIIGFIIYMAFYLISPDFGVRFGSYFVILDGVIIARYMMTCHSFTNKMVLFLIFSLVALYKIYTYTLIPAYEYKWLLS